MKRARLFALALLLTLLGALSSTAADQGPRLLHLPVKEKTAEQGILTPVPLELGLPADLARQATRVLVHYRVWGDPDWSSLELRRKGARWTGAIPCLEVSTITGDLRYYFRIHDAEGRVVASSGSRVHPYVVTIRYQPKPGQKARCPDPADCPRGLPGCPSEPVKLIPCKSDRDCEGGSECSWKGFCEKSGRDKNWVSLALEQDFGVVTRTGMCSVASQENEGSACFRRTDGKNYTGNPVLTNEPLGVGHGPTRLLLGYDRLLDYQSSLGPRVGWAFAGEGPSLRGAAPFVPWSAALRVSHWLFEDPFGRPGLRPYLFMTAGYAQFDIRTSTRVREDPTKYDIQGGNDLEQTLDAHKRAGDAFAGLGAGLELAPSIGTQVGIEVSVLQAFPYSATILVPAVSAGVGF